MGRAADDTGVGASLWLMPEGGVGVRLAALIDELARRHRTPAFPPHLTLLGAIPGPEAAALARAADLARSLEPMEIRLGKVETGDAYFRCLFVRAEETEALRRAYAQAREVFGRTDAAPFLPHVSLLYGRVGPEGKAAVRKELGGRLEAAFEARRLHVFLTQGPPQAWRGRGAFPLGT